MVEAGTPSGSDSTMDPPIGIDVDTTMPGRIIVNVHGEIDMFTAPQLRKSLLSCTDNPDTHIVVDLSEVSFLGSTGLQLLIEALQQARSSGATLSLVSASRHVIRPLTLTGLDEVFDIYPSRDELPPV